mmetsp:Transcript_14496/g.26068  ORF Transcript_14496/g.26068 Transcript_14496/m.26068 type:complete len:336 (-) Transcript_14496:74-1081(-)
MEGKRRRKENAPVRAAWKMDAAQEFLEVKLKNSFDGIWSETAANTNGSHPKSPQSMGGTHLSAQRGGGGNDTTDVQIAVDNICSSGPSRNMQVFVHIFKLYKILLDGKSYREYQKTLREVYSKTLLKVLISVSRTRDPLLFISLRVLRLFCSHPDFYEHAAQLNLGAVLLEVFEFVETKSQIAEAVALLRVLSEGPIQFRRTVVGPTGRLAVAIMQLFRLPLVANTPGVMTNLLWVTYNLTSSSIFCEVLHLKGFPAFSRTVANNSRENFSEEDKTLCERIRKYSSSYIFAARTRANNNNSKTITSVSEKNGAGVRGNNALFERGVGRKLQRKAR